MMLLGRVDLAQLDSFGKRLVKRLGIVAPWGGRGGWLFDRVDCGECCARVVY